MKQFFMMMALTLSSAWAHAGLSEGIWSVHGTNSQKGGYQGELELRRNQDGSFNAVRIITYQAYSFMGYQVQEIWTGKASLDKNTLRVNYSLRQADYITRAGNHVRNPNDFKSNVTVQSVFVQGSQGPHAEFTNQKGATYSEQLGQARALQGQPLWKDLRTKFDAKGPSIPLVIRGAIEVARVKVEYEKDPFVKSYMHRKEYKNEQPYVIFDPTDYDFYQRNKTTLRVANKITDEISLTESLMRRNAYAPTYEEKARGYEKNTQERHINDQGMYVSLQVDANNNIVNEDSEGDSTLWTGMYVGSQAMRYLITKDPVAQANVRRSVKAMFLLMDLPGDRSEFARTVETFNPNRQYAPKWHRGTGKYSSLMWMEGGNNDMVKGITHSFMWATLVIPRSDTEIWDQLKEKSRRLIDLEVMDKKAQNRPVALGLAALITQDKELREKYLKSYLNPKTRLTSGYDFDTSFYWHGTADWSGINLGMVGAITNIMVADLLGAEKIRNTLRERFMDEWLVYKPARRHLHTIATYGFAYRHGTRGDNFRRDSSEQDFKERLAHSLWGLREIPYPRLVHGTVQVDHSLNPEWCLSPIPRLFWKSLKKPEPPPEYFYQGLYDYPLFEQDAIDSTFIWKSAAFNYRVNHGSGTEYAGIDYLYAYWLARYSGLELR
ncbi:hypothetical protein [Bdellovibrio sp. HCB337]|uniref:hypothetical protein n=1 Tax=Bdellovibrio sp. HCB337 TaxID=3394358 RepID=UPI0039A57811